MTQDPVRQRSQISKSLEAYWRSLASSGSLPKFESFDLLDIPDLIPNLMFVQVFEEPDRHLIVRFSGTIVRDRAEFDPTGHDFLDFYDRSQREAAWRTIQTSLRHSCGFLVNCNAQYKNAPGAVMEGSAFPFASQDGKSFYSAGVVEWVGVNVARPAETPVLILEADSFSWLDVGFGVPGKEPRAAL